MTAEETAKLPTTQAPPRRNKGLHGAFWTEQLLRFLRFTPLRLALICAHPITLVIYLLAGAQRRAIQRNLSALRPEFGLLRRWWAGYRVFLEFGLTYLDRLWHMHFQREVTWDIPHKERFDAMRALPSGVLIFTIHSGNYDIGASLFAQKFGRTLHTVRAPEQTEELQALRMAELRRTECENPLLRVHYSVADNHLGIELCRILRAGEAVAVQGDRVITSVSPVAMSHAGRTYNLPRGPLVLAEIARVPCHPIFLERIGCLHYRIHVGECFYDGRTKIRADDVGKIWLPIMHDYIQNHWDQWFVFEPLVTMESPLTDDTPKAA
jgi:predicted LPLAT superfamily acyltransferase